MIARWRYKLSTFAARSLRTFGERMERSTLRIVHGYRAVHLSRAGVAAR
jgi:hypothetical protein